jgi:hypothetical protein
MFYLQMGSLVVSERGLFIDEKVLEERRALRRQRKQERALRKEEKQRRRHEVKLAKAAAK